MMNEFNIHCNLCWRIGIFLDKENNKTSDVKAIKIKYKKPVLLSTLIS